MLAGRLAPAHAIPRTGAELWRRHGAPDRAADDGAAAVRMFREMGMRAWLARAESAAAAGVR